MIEESEKPPVAVVLDASAWYQIDVTSADILQKMVKELRIKGLDVFLADVHLPVRNYARETGLLDAIGEDHLFPTIDTAVKVYRKNCNQEKN